MLSVNIQQPHGGVMILGNGRLPLCVNSKKWSPVFVVTTLEEFCLHGKCALAQA